MEIKLVFHFGLLPRGIIGIGSPRCKFPCQNAKSRITQRLFQAKIQVKHVQIRCGFGG